MLIINFVYLEGHRTLSPMFKVISFVKMLRNDSYVPMVLLDSPLWPTNTSREDAFMYFWMFPHSAQKEKTAAENKLPLLDALAHKLQSGTYETSAYRKATRFGIVLPYDSNSPDSFKRSCVAALCSRITTHCANTEARNQERNYILWGFDNNGYPLNSINSQPPPTTNGETVPPT